MKNKSILIASAILMISTGAMAVTSYLNAANSVSLKVTAMYLGSFSSGKCQGWKTVFEDASLPAQNFTQSLDIGSGTVAQGSSDCLALRVENSLGVTTNSSAGGACAGWTGQHIFAPGLVQSGQTASDLDGNVIAHDTDTPSSLYLFFRVGGSGDVFNATDGAALNQPISVGEGTTTISFKFQASAGHSITDLQDDSGTCTFDDGNVGFAVEQN